MELLELGTRFLIFFYLFKKNKELQQVASQKFRFHVGSMLAYLEPDFSVLFKISIILSRLFEMLGFAHSV